MVALPLLGLILQTAPSEADSPGKPGSVLT